MNITNLTLLDDRLASSGQPTREQFAEIAAVGFETIINLALSSSDNALPDEAELVRSLGLEYIHIPVIWDAPQAENLQQFMDALDARHGKKIFVHCAMNYRASAFIALWRCLRLGWEPEKAFATQQTIWRLEDYPIWKKFVETALESASY